MAREDMRLVEVIALSEAACGDVLAVLDEKELDYAVTDRTQDSDTATVISVPLPAHGVEPIQRRLDDLATSEDTYTAVIEPETLDSGRIAGTEDGYEPIEGLGHQGIARSELYSNATDMLPDFSIYALMTAISAIVATAGVLLDSLAVLVGSMVIAPLISPPMATSVATVIDDAKLFARGVKYQIVGGLLGVASATGFAVLIRSTGFVSSRIDIATVLDASNHTAPGLLLIVVALSSGVAGAISISTSATIGLVGVMIAAAIIPPLGIVGVGLAWGRLTVVAGSLAVVLLNVLSINLAATVCLWYLGYHPESWSELRKVRGTMLVRIAALAAAIGLLATFLANLAGGNLAFLTGLLP